MWETQWGDSKELSKNFSSLNNGVNVLKVKVCDDAENCSEDSVSFNLNLPSDTNSDIKNTISINLSENKTTLKSSDFPLAINLEVLNINPLAKLDLYLRSENNTLIKAAQSLKSFNGSMLSTVWSKIPEKGVYYLYAEGVQWSGDTIKSDEIKLTIN